MSVKSKLFWSASIMVMGAAPTPLLAQEAPAAAAPAAQEDEDEGAEGGRARETESTELGEIVVTGVRASMIKGLEIKRESTQIVDSIVAEDIGKLPDNNVVEALQRVPGVQVTNRGAGEVGAVFIRGLPDITTTWNSRLVFTAAGRQFALQDIPANLVSRIDVYKTRAAEQIETGIAGQIDVHTRRPFDFKGFALSASARAIYHEQADKVNPNVSALLSNRWDTGIGDVGALVNASYSRTQFRDQSVTAGAMVPYITPDNPPAGFAPLQRISPRFWTPGLERGLPTAPGSTLTINGQQVPYLLARDAVFASDFTGERERPAINAALQWSPDTSTEYTFEFMWEGFRQETFNNLHFTFVDWWGALGPNPASTITLFPNTNIIKTRTVNFPFGFNSGDFSRGKTDSFIYALNGKWGLGEKFSLTADVAYQTSKFRSEFLAMRTIRVADTVSVDFNTGNGIPSWEFGNNSQLADPAQWLAAELFDNANRSEGDALTFTLDGDYEPDRGILRRLSFGLRFDDRGAKDAFRTQFAPCICRPFNQFDPGLHHVNKNFFDGRANVPQSWVVANGRYLADNADAIRSIYRQAGFGHIQTSDTLQVLPNFTVDELTTAAYVQADFEYNLLGRPLHFQAGARYVYVDTDTSFIDRQSGAETSGSGSVGDLLPSFTLRYDITDTLRLRANYGETLRRPNFADLNPNVVYTDDLTNVGFGTGFGGNPSLEATTARNIDLGIEWYFENDSAIYGTIFRRDIDGLVVPLRQIETRVIPGNVATRYAIVRPRNASDGVLQGAELGFVFFPDLPGLFNGLGTQGSFTWLDSSQNIPTTNDAGEIVGEEDSAFFGVSDFSYSVTLAYDRGPLDMRLSYVWREAFLNNNEARLFANPIGIWRRPEKSLDFQVTYDVTPRLGVTFDAVNLTDEINQSYYRFADAGGPFTHNFGSTIRSRTFAVGVRYTLD